MFLNKKKKENMLLDGTITKIIKVLQVQHWPPMSNYKCRNFANTTLTVAWSFYPRKVLKGILFIVKQDI